MATLKMIDTSKAFTLMAYSHERTTIAELVELAEHLDDPKWLNSTEPTRGAEPCRFDDAAGFSAWLESTSWAARLEQDLQCIAEDGQGRPLLTTWIDIREFKQMVADAQGTAYGSQLLEALNTWKALKPDEVMIDAHLKR